MKGNEADIDLVLEHSIMKVCGIIRKKMALLMKTYTKKYEIGMCDMELIMFLGHSPHNTARDFSRHSSITRSLVSRSVDTLVQKKLIMQEVDKNDRRVVHLILTDEGKQIMDDLDGTVKYLERESLSGISEKDIDVTRKVLNAILQNYERILEDAR